MVKNKVSARRFCTPRSTARSALFSGLAPVGNPFRTSGAYADNYAAFALGSQGSSRFLSALFLAIALFFSGCAKPQIIKEAKDRNPAICGGRRQGLKAALLLLAIPLAAVFSGCAKFPAIEKVIYLDKPCDRASDYTQIEWLKVRWISVVIDGVGYVATPDGEALLGNLYQLLPQTKPNQKETK
ncbi:MAG: hypothetical protein LBN32_01865 [Helicobacteraceae bacterium]|jgi:hypothetical protein|nr:hypothetical protein [Helicobacteraceae bacterium]